MKTLEEVLGLSTAYLEQRGIAKARFAAEEVLAEALGIGRLDLYMDFHRPLVEHELELCRALLGRRGKREPMQYIRGTQDFFGLDLKVDERALIPRHETEILVDTVVQELKGLDLAGKVLWDICCGSGCIGLALKKAFPQLTVVLSDISREALALAGENAERNGLEVVFRQGDLLNAFPDEKADFVLCNPPYIAASDFGRLEPEVSVYEPKSALIGGDDGLDFYRRLAAHLPPYLNRPARVFLEMGMEQGRDLQEIFAHEPWQRGVVGKDWAGHDRFFSLEIL